MEDDDRVNPCSLCPCCEAEEGSDYCAACRESMDYQPEFEPPPREERTMMVWDRNEDM